MVIAEVSEYSTCIGMKARIGGSPVSGELDACVLIFCIVETCGLIANRK
jgi:hypothetical protein